ncbi:MAG: cobalamin biosynthesis protein CbiX [Microbacterium sp. SCN 70-200]|uniref:sirohydrochlorin chelatase n=1 Tax=unclassified Microbacterium TaxID=2609290 RepID=UPI00086C27D2|nr:MULTISPECIES: CbiX/SirB N-terminal domain-containing protein [unclassified Microbacterium]MBN9213531.1 sirohydrochlorin chelatase [Microbacterium sp.]ODT41651.1 MAG: cobalamin biosynthesis protein CbiX [Microbacterium sp. SCN 70-200]OJV85157.1 MAG: cobalamin biosynthesis protein CbiX [Microbacterium sp. 70-16]
MTATLIACSHGTSDEAGRAAVLALVDQVRQLLPGVDVVDAFVDVQDPAVADVVDSSVAGGSAVVVPLLLSTGYHTNVDISRAIGAHPGRAVATAALGPHELLADVLVDRLAEVGAEPGDAIVLAAAGSSDPAAAVDVAATADLLASRLDADVSVGFAAGAGRRIADVVADARAAGAQRVVIASYVLAPGYFAQVIAAAGGDVVTRPLAPDTRIAEIIAERYRAGVGALSA